MDQVEHEYNIRTTRLYDALSHTQLGKLLLCMDFKWQDAPITSDIVVDPYDVGLAAIGQCKVDGDTEEWCFITPAGVEIHWTRCVALKSYPYFYNFWLKAPYSAERDRHETESLILGLNLKVIENSI